MIDCVQMESAIVGYSLMETRCALISVNNRYNTLASLAYSMLHDRAPSAIRRPVCEYWIVTGLGHFCIINEVRSEPH